MCSKFWKSDSEDEIRHFAGKTFIEWQLDQF